MLKTILMPVGVACAGVVTGILAWSFFRKKRGNVVPVDGVSCEPEYLEHLSLEEVIAWFHAVDTSGHGEDDIVNCIARFPSKGVHPIPEKIRKEDYPRIFVMAVFDSKSKKTLTGRYVVCQKLGNDIHDLLGTDDLVILT